MKHLYKYLFLSLVIIVVGCSDNPTNTENPDPKPEPPQSEYPYYNGTWKVTSEDSADWVGDRSKNKSTLSTDTLEIDSPTGYSLSIAESTTFNTPQPSAFDVTFVDSNLTLQDIKDNNITGGIGFEGNEFSSGQMSFSSLDYTTWEVSYSYTCDSTAVEDDTYLRFKIVKNEVETFKVFAFKAKGFLPTIHDISCPS